MKVLSSEFRHKLNVPRIASWGKLFAVVGSAQTIIQGFSLLSGILIIRLLPTHEYALYTLVNTVLGTLTVLADGGITNSVFSLGGPNYNNRTKLGSIVVTGLKLRKRFGVVALSCLIPILVFLLLRHDASLLMCLLIVLSLIPAFYAMLSDSILEVAPKLNQDIVVLQKNQIAAGGGRLVLTSLSLMLFPFSFVAILASGFPRIWANIRLRKAIAGYTDFQQPDDPVIRSEIYKLVKRTLPSALYYSISAQFAVWLISFVGQTTSLAQLGALTRIAIMYNLLSVVFYTLVTPRFSRLPQNRQLLSRRYIMALLACTFIIAVLIAVGWIFSGEILWVLGSEYEGLDMELIVCFLASGLALIAGLAYSLNIARGWVIQPLIAIPANILAIISGAMIFEVTTLMGAALFNCFVTLVSLATHALYGLWKLKSLPDASQ